MIQTAAKKHRTIEQIGTSIMLRRENLGLSQNELARMAQTSRASISRIETGHQGIAIGVVVRVASALGVDLGEL